MAKEKEIKILNVDANEITKKLKKIGAVYKNEGLQDLCTYDFLPLISRYNSLIDSDKYVENKKITKNRWLAIAKDVDCILNSESRTELEKITGYNYFVDFAKSAIESNKIYMLDNEDIKELIKKNQNKLIKWVRLRKGKGKIELTIKQILSDEIEYNISDVEEHEITVSDFDIANDILEHFGFVPTNRQQKYRISYSFNDLDIEIDKWPLINCYLEIEGKDEEKIYELVSLLGYKKADTKVMNTTDVYSLYGINLFDYDQLTFELEKDE